MSAWPRCVNCGHPIEPSDTNKLVEVIGWAKLRDAGGQNHVIDRRETGRVMCGECAIRLRSGLPVEQESLI